MTRKFKLVNSKKYIRDSEGEKVKVGIVTFSFALNYGSLLQCYALQETINNMGHEAYIVDLKENNKESYLSMKARFRGLVVTVASTFEFIPIIKDRNNKVRKFQEFRNLFNLTDECDDISDLQKIANKLDVLIVGSDQVWNPHLQDFTYLFMLPVSGVKRIGYSISMGKAQEKDIEKYKSDISGFDAISVRERQIKEPIERLYGREVYVTVDPTFLLGADKWKHFMENAEVNVNSPYLLCFLFGKNKEYNTAKYKFVDAVAKEMGLKIIYLNHGYNRRSFLKNSYCDCGIEDFIKLFRDASLIITDSFHGTVFSIIFQKDFYAILDSKSTDRRKQDLLETMGISKRAVDISASNISWSRESIDYYLVDAKLKQLKQDALDYLRNEIG